MYFERNGGIFHLANSVKDIKELLSRSKLIHPILRDLFADSFDSSDLSTGVRRLSTKSSIRKILASLFLK